MSALLADVVSSTALNQKDRFLAFAFAASDLLVEAGPDGIIGFAAGAFRARFGLAPESFNGRHLRTLFAAADHLTLELAISTVGLRGRLTPMVLRLSDPAATPMIVSGLTMPHAPGRLCFTMGRLPLPLESREALSLAKPANLIRTAEARLRGDEGGTLGLVDLRHWSQACEALPPEAHCAFQAEITEVLTRLAGPGSVAGELAAGRFGVVGDRAPDLAAVAAELERLLSSHPATAGTEIQSIELGLDREQLTGAQAARALRFALARFADSGARATEDAGFGSGLVDFVTSAQAGARTVRNAIMERRFHLAFQPVVNLVSQGVHHYEVLLRPIFTPGQPIQTTQDFVTFAEAVGLSEDLDWAVMHQTVSTLEDVPGIAAAVNVSGLSMQSPSFRQRMLDLLANPKTAGRILVELTETADIEDLESAKASIKQLRDMQVPVCIDDFGAGSAAFRYLKEFRVDYVKLDGAYVRGALQNAREHGFLLTMIDLANFVGAKVIAETVETEQEAAMMRELGVEYGQGWYFGRPGQLPGIAS